MRAGVDVPRKPVVWEDLTTGKFHAVNNETGEEVPVDRNGRPIAQFHHGISGIASTHERNSLRLKDVALQKSLLLPEGRRPKLKKEDKITIREERVETVGRFGSKTPVEAELFLRQQVTMKQLYPELEAQRQEEEAKARYKIEELHKNYYALQASNEAGKGGPVVKKERDIKGVSRSQQYSFTSTGVFRP